MDPTGTSASRYGRQTNGRQVVHLLDLDPGLGDGLTEAELEMASRSLRGQLIHLRPGAWRAPVEPEQQGHLGYLVVDGLLVRRLQLGSGVSVELLGEGDILRPWQEDASSFCVASWEVIEPTLVVSLSRRFAQCLGRWPAIVTNILGRAVGRSRALAADGAIASIVGVEQRLLLLLWQLAERWGETGAGGVRLRIRLPHRLLAELLAARRPSVTAAIGRLEARGHLAETADGRWLLRGNPPC